MEIRDQSNGNRREEGAKIREEWMVEIEKQRWKINERT